MYSLNNCVLHSQYVGSFGPYEATKCLGNYSQFGPAFVANYRNQIVPRLRLHGLLAVETFVY